MRTEPTPGKRPGLFRDQGFRFAVLGIGAAVGIGVAVLMLLTSGRRLPWQVLLITLLGALVLVFAATLVGLLIGRRLVGDRIEIALRDGGGRWRHGRVVAGPGRIEFQPYLWQVRVPSGAVEDLPVQSLDLAGARRPPWRSLLALNPQVRIVEATIDGRPTQLAALPSRLRQLQARVQPS